MLFDSVPIENYLISVLHAESDIGNKIMFPYFEWINERIELISECEVNMTKF